MKIKRVTTTKKGADGERVAVQSRKFYAEFVDFSGRLRRVALTADEKAAGKMAEKIDRLNDMRAAGATMPPELSRWIESAPKPLIERLVSFDLVPAAMASAAATLVEHVADWKLELSSKKRTHKHTHQLAQRVLRLFEACEFTLWSDVSAGPILVVLSGWQKPIDGKRKGISHQTYNFYVQAVRQFGRWMKKRSRTIAEPLESLDLLSVQSDRRHDRRALTLEEFTWLSHAAENSPVREGIAPADRAILYEAAVTTGLRAGELRSILVGDLDFEKGTITIRAKSAKNRREANLPLSARMVERLKKHVEGRPLEAHVFALPPVAHLSEMIRIDLGAARAAYIATATTAEEIDERTKSDFCAYVNSRGEHLDFHALRHTRGVWLFVYHDAKPKEVQALMRVSSLALVDRYTRSFKVDGAALTERGPDLSVRPTAKMVETEQKPSVKQGGDKQADKLSGSNAESSASAECNGGDSNGLQNRLSRVRIPLRPVTPDSKSPEKTELSDQDDASGDASGNSLNTRQNPHSGDKPTDKPHSLNEDPRVAAALEESHGERCAANFVDDLIAGAVSRLRNGAISGRNGGVE